MQHKLARLEENYFITHTGILKPPLLRILSCQPLSSEQARGLTVPELFRSLKKELVTGFAIF